MIIFIIDYFYDFYFYNYFNYFYFYFYNYFETISLTVFVFGKSDDNISGNSLLI
jgi:hypothetical protein